MTIDKSELLEENSSHKSKSSKKSKSKSSKSVSKHDSNEKIEPEEESPKALAEPTEKVETSNYSTTSPPLHTVYPRPKLLFEYVQLFHPFRSFCLWKGHRRG